MDGIDDLFSRPPWPSQVYGVTKAIESIEAKQSCCVTSPTGCHAAGTKVILANGMTWAIEDIVPGNLLLGPDSKPRTVLQLHRGRDMMYRISPVKGKPFVVNGSHVLSLKRTNDGTKQSGCIEFCTVNEWLSWSKTKKHIMKLWKPGPVDFPLAQPLTPILIPPWELGVLLGDGCIKRSCSFDNPDKELIDRMGAFASRLGYCMTKSSKPYSLSDTYRIVRPKDHRGRSEGNIVIDELKWLNLFGCIAEDKFIPLEYLTADCQSRLSLLAGLLDTDGHLSNKGFDYITKSRQLCDDVTFLARSLGFAAEPAECYKYCQTGAGGLYHRISISGDTQRIPCVIARKQAGERRQKKSWTVTGFSVEPVGIGDYYGFSLDGDQQYLTDDFFVHHNSGKTVIQIALIRWCAQTGRRVILYTNRIMLTEQTMRVLDAHNVEYGVIAATQKDRMALLRDVQLASIQTVNARVNRTKRNELWKADVVICDESHQISSGASEKILRAHEEHGGVLVGFTATPLGLSHLYPHLIIAARNSDCRKFGALVPAKVYAPAEMNTASLKLQDNGEFSYEDIKREVFNVKTRNAIFGHVHDHWRRLNPDAKPALGFAPGVAEAKWFVDQFAERGVRCASIDGEDCYIDGEEHKTSQSLRQEIVEEARQGRVAIIWNRFVLREGIDFPWLHHLILATPIGSLTSYVQVVGRVLRFSEQTPSFVCLARGTPVLTNRGEVPIQDVKQDDLVWDGVEFVSHGGACCTGRTEVIEWDGLTATPTHKVLTNDGWTTLEEAKARNRRLTRSSFLGSPVRVLNDSDPYSESSSSETDTSAGVVLDLRKDVVCVSSQNGTTCSSRMQELHETLWTSLPRVDLPASPASMEEMLRREQQRVQELWGERDSVSVRFGVGCVVLDSIQSRCSERPQYADRQDRQRRQLRARELAVGYEVTANEESKEVHQAELHTAEVLGCIPECWLHTAEHKSPDCQRSSLGRDRISVGDLEQKAEEVWDIINAGPRHRFTASGVIVGNCIQDHGGNYWRHGSPNQDWDWERWYCTNPSLPTRVRMDAIRERREETAICCHKCGMVRSSGILCPACGTQMNKKRRAVIQKDGTLREMYGEPLPRKYIKEEPDTYTKWKSMVHRMRNADMEMSQAEGLFAKENGYWPPPDLPMMPKYRVDKFQKIRRIPVENLISVDEHVSMRVEAGKEPAQGVIERFKQERLF